jgi:uncharacterized protein DUF6285
MRDCPDASGLLLAARDVVRRELMPNLPEHLRYEALMVTNALAIVARQLQAARFSERAELDQLVRLLVDSGTGADADADERAALIAANRRLCHEIRAGRFDPGQPGADTLVEHLFAITRAKLVESNPKALPGGA